MEICPTERMDTYLEMLVEVFFLLLPDESESRLTGTT